MSNAIRMIGLALIITCGAVAIDHISTAPQGPTALKPRDVQSGFWGPGPQEAIGLQRLERKPVERLPQPSRTPNDCAIATAEFIAVSARGSSSVVLHQLDTVVDSCGRSEALRTLCDRDISVRNRGVIFETFVQRTDLRGEAEQAAKDWLAWRLAHSDGLSWSEDIGFIQVLCKVKGADAEALLLELIRRRNTGAILAAEAIGGFTTEGQVEVVQIAVAMAKTAPGMSKRLLQAACKTDDSTLTLECLRIAGDETYPVSLRRSAALGAAAGIPMNSTSHSFGLLLQDIPYWGSLAPDAIETILLRMSAMPRGPDRLDWAHALVEALDLYSRSLSATSQFDIQFAEAIRVRIFEGIGK